MMGEGHERIGFRKVSACDADRDVVADDPKGADDPFDAIPCSRMDIDPFAVVQTA